MSSLYILDISPLSNIWFAKISPICRVPFRLVILYFPVQKLLRLIQSRLLIFAFVFCAFGVIVQKSLQDQRQGASSPLFLLGIL